VKTSIKKGGKIEIAEPELADEDGFNSGSNTQANEVKNPVPAHKTTPSFDSQSI